MSQSLKVVKLMKEHGYSQIPVFNGKQSVGSVSEKTILRQILAGKDLDQISNLPTEDIMEEAFPQVGEDAPLIVDFQSTANLSGGFSGEKGTCGRHHH